MQASLEAVVHAGTPHQREIPLVRMASERIIVRASNPGQFEPGGPGGTAAAAAALGSTVGVVVGDPADPVAAAVGAAAAAAASAGCLWRRSPASPDTLCHVGRVGINTEQVRRSGLLCQR